MNYIITEPHNMPLILCGIFYSILCIFSIVTGLIYASGRRKLNPIELSDKFLDKLSDEDKLKKFTIKMGWVTFIVGIIQGLTALAIFKGYNVYLNLFAICFTIFSIISVIVKLKGKVNAFPIIKLFFYVSILIILLLNGINNYGATDEAIKYLKSTDVVKVSKIDEGYYFDGPGSETAIIFYPGARVEYTSYAKLMYRLAENGEDTFLLGMPLNFAFLGINKPDSIIEKYDYSNYYLSGHSLGGVAASMYTSSNPDKIKGLIMLSSYPTKKLPDGIEYISIYGSEDKVLNIDKYNDSKKYFPDNYKEYVIEGGNHAGFGNYGNQKGDGISKITSDEQEEYVIKLLLGE